MSYRFTFDAVRCFFRSTAGAVAIETALVIPLLILLTMITVGTVLHLRSQNSLNRETASLADMLANGAVLAADISLSPDEVLDAHASVALALLEKSLQHESILPVKAGVIVSIYDSSVKDEDGNTHLQTARAGLVCPVLPNEADLAEAAEDGPAPLVVDPLSAFALVRLQTCIEPQWPPMLKTVKLPILLQSRFTAPTTVIRR